MKFSITTLGQQFAADSVGGGGSVLASIHGQVTALESKLTKNQKPYYALTLSDGEGTMELKVWNNVPAYPQCTSALTRMKEGPLFVALEGSFKNGEYGFESNDFRFRLLNDDDTRALLEGTPEQQEKVALRWNEMLTLIGTMQDGALRQLCQYIVNERGEEYKRAAAARGNHHARRGGLVEHVSLMMKSADAICGIYPQLNRSLMLAGAFLHDIGKLVENQYEARGFDMPFTAKAELAGHIPIGVEIVRETARKIYIQAELENEELKYTIDCLCHMILSHHGQLEWGSPVEPKFPEAAGLHFIDNLDAKVEGMRAAYVGAGQRKPGDVIEKVWPMRHNLVVPPKERP